MGLPLTSMIDADPWDSYRVAVPVVYHKPIYEDQQEAHFNFQRRKWRNVGKGRAIHLSRVVTGYFSRREIEIVVRLHAPVDPTTAAVVDIVAVISPKTAVDMFIVVVVVVE